MVFILIVVVHQNARHVHLIHHLPNVDRHALLIHHIIQLISSKFSSSSSSSSPKITPPSATTGSGVAVDSSSTNQLNSFFFHAFLIIGIPSISQCVLAAQDAMSLQVGDLTMPCLSIMAIIHSSQLARTLTMNGLFSPTLSGCSKPVQPPGMWITSTPNSWMARTTEPIKWHR